MEANKPSRISVSCVPKYSYVFIWNKIFWVWVWVWKTIGHLFYDSASFVHHFVTIGEFTLELQSGNAQFGSKLAIFCPVWPWNLMDHGWPWKTIGHLFYDSASFVHHFVTIGEFTLELQSGNAQFGSKLAIFCPVWPWNLMDHGWPWKTIGHLFYDSASFVHHFVTIGEFKLELQSGNAQIGSKSKIFWAGWLWNLTDHLEKQ